MPCEWEFGRLKISAFLMLLPLPHFMNFQEFYVYFMSDAKGTLRRRRKAIFIFFMFEQPRKIISFSNKCKIALLSSIWLLWNFFLLSFYIAFRSSLNLLLYIRFFFFFCPPLFSFNFLTRIFLIKMNWKVSFSVN